MGKNEKVYLKFMLFIFVILGIILLAFAGMLLFASELLFKIIKIALISLCGIGGITYLIAALICAIKYSIEKKKIITK